MNVCGGEEQLRNSSMNQEVSVCKSGKKQHCQSQEGKYENDKDKSLSRWREILQMQKAKEINIYYENVTF